MALDPKRFHKSVGFVAPAKDGVVVPKVYRNA